MRFFKNKIGFFREKENGNKFLYKMRKLIIILSIIIEFLICIKLLDWSFMMISSPDNFLVALGFVGLMFFVVLIFLSIKIIKKIWK